VKRKAKRAVRTETEHELRAARLSLRIAVARALEACARLRVTLVRHRSGRSVERRTEYAESAWFWATMVVVCRESARMALGVVLLIRGEVALERRLARELREFNRVLRRMQRTRERVERGMGAP
jgi:hypothetical protein